jgi:hypothetical protein
MNNFVAVRHYTDLIPTRLTHRTSRHRPWGDLQPIQPPSLPLDTICIDFIIGLPVSSKDNNCCMSLTCHLSKRIGVIPEKDTNTAEDWGIRILDLFLHCRRGDPGKDYIRQRSEVHFGHVDTDIEALRNPLVNGHPKASQAGNSI